MKIICTNCKRFYETPGEGEVTGRPTHTECARCACGLEMLFLGQRHTPPGDLKRKVSEEITAGIPWQGEEKFKYKFKPEHLALYDALAAEVTAERDGRGEAGSEYA